MSNAATVLVIDDELPIRRFLRGRPALSGSLRAPAP